MCELDTGFKVFLYMQTKIVCLHKKKLFYKYITYSISFWYMYIFLIWFITLLLLANSDLDISLEQWIIYYIRRRTEMYNKSNIFHIMVSKKPFLPKKIRTTQNIWQQKKRHSIYIYIVTNATYSWFIWTRSHWFVTYTMRHYLMHNIIHKLFFK